MKKLFLIISMLTMGFVFNGCEKDNPNATSNSNSNSDSDSTVGCMDMEAINYDEDATEPCEDDECCEYGDSTVGCMDPEAINYDADATEPCEDDECCEYADDDDYCDHCGDDECDGDCHDDECDNGMVIIMNEADEMMSEVCLTNGTIYDFGCEEFCNQDIHLYGDDFSMYLELYYDQNDFEVTYYATEGSTPFFSSSSHYYSDDYDSYGDLNGGFVEVSDYGSGVYEITFNLSSDDTTLTGTYYGELEEDRSLRSKKANK